MRHTSLALAAALILSSPVAAYAVAGETPTETTTETAPVQVTRTVTWFGYYTPGDKQSTNRWDGLAHTYHQFLLKSNLSLSCGQRYITQTDVMVGTEDELDSVTADGKLTAGEDSHVTKSWVVTFHEEPTCPTSTPTPTPTETPSTPPAPSPSPTAPPVGPPEQPTTSASPPSTGPTVPSSSPSSTPSTSPSQTPSTTSAPVMTSSTPKPSTSSTPSPTTTTSVLKPVSSPTSGSTPTATPAPPAQYSATALPYTGTSNVSRIIVVAIICVVIGLALIFISEKG